MATAPEHLRSRTAWKRVLFMLLFALLYGIAEVVAGAVVLFQVGSVLLTGRPNRRLLALGQQLATYLYEVVLFLTYRSEQMPFPFAEWPSGPPKPACLPPPDEAVTSADDSDLDGG